VDSEKKVQFLLNVKACGRLGRTVTKFRIFRGSVKAFILNGCETWKVTKRPTRVLQTFVNRRLTKIFQVFWPNLISNEEMWRRIQKKISGSANKPTEMEVNWIYNGEEPLCLKQTLSWNPPKETEQEQEENDRAEIFGERSNQQFKCSLLLLHRSPVLQNGVQRNDLRYIRLSPRCYTGSD
jgi:hypothetical protein